MVNWQAIANNRQYVIGETGQVRFEIYRSALKIVGKTRPYETFCDLATTGNTLSVRQGGFDLRFIEAVNMAGRTRPYENFCDRQF